MLITFDSLDQIFQKIVGKGLLLYRMKKCKSHIMRFFCIKILFSQPVRMHVDEICPILNLEVLQKVRADCFCLTLQEPQK
jgi:hypothetical protein